MSGRYIRKLAAFSESMTAKIPQSSTKSLRFQSYDPDQNPRGTSPSSAYWYADLFAKRTRNSLRKITSPRQDLTFEQLKIYY